MTEKYLQYKIIQRLKSEGAFVKKVIIANTTGTPDIFACWRGIFISIEVKKRGKKPNVLQLFNMQEITKAGGVAFWTDDYDDCMRKLESGLEEVERRRHEEYKKIENARKEIEGI